LEPELPLLLRRHPCSSFPRKRESSSFFGLCLLLCLNSKRFHSSCGGAGYFLLNGQEKVTKEKPPRTSRSSGILPYDFARGLRGSLDARPCAFNELAHIVCAIAARLFLRPRAATHGAPARAARSCAQKQRQQPASWGALARLCALALLCLSLLRARSALLLGPRRARRAHGGSGPVRGRVHDARALPNVYGRTSGKPRSALAHPQHRDCAEGATDRGRLLFGYFLLARQEKVTRSSARGVEALALQQTGQSERRNWIPAYAGMTSQGLLRRRSGSFGSTTDRTERKKELDSCLRRNDEPMAPPQEEWKLWLLKTRKKSPKKELDYTRLLPRALRAIRYANVRSASCLRSPAYAGMTSKDCSEGGVETPAREDQGQSWIAACAGMTARSSLLEQGHLSGES